MFATSLRLILNKVVQQGGQSRHSIFVYVPLASPSLEAGAGASDRIMMSFSHDDVAQIPGQTRETEYRLFCRTGSTLKCLFDAK